MIELANKVDCCGCSACEQICPKQCIMMKPDEEGFLYPVINKEICIDCGRCEKVCPVLNKKQGHSLLDAYAFNNVNNQERYDSASGGFFSAISKYLVRQNGVVFGAAYNSEVKVVTSFTDKEEELWKFRNSKYVQSEVKDSYKEAKKLLLLGKKVLFSGTPCQIQGLLNFLGKEYENLYTMDFVCHGVPSPKVFEKYKVYIQQKYGSNLVTYQFRTKRKGYNGKSYGCANIELGDGRTLHTEDTKGSDLFMSKSFFEEVCSRPSCHVCRFKDKERNCDFTVFDCWSVQKIAPNLSDDKGTTLLVVNTQKGKDLFEKASDFYQVNKVDLDKAIMLDGLMMLHSVPAHPLRNAFLLDLDRMSVEDLTKKYLTPKGMKRVKIFIRDITERLGLLRYIRYVKYALKR